MAQCFTTANFSKYFKENMNAMGAPVPQSLFTTCGTALATVRTIFLPLETLGKSATVAELINATTGLEKIKGSCGIWCRSIRWDRNRIHRRCYRPIFWMRFEIVGYIGVFRAKPH